MRWIIGIAVVVVLAFVGYESFRPVSRPPVAVGPVQPAAPAAGGASSQTAPPAA